MCANTVRSKRAAERSPKSLGSEVVPVAPTDVASAARFADDRPRNQLSLTSDDFKESRAQISLGSLYL
jgi:hypothetical protein